MKTFDNLYNELQNGDNSEINNLLKQVQKESKKSNRISLVICLIIDAFILMGSSSIDAPTFMKAVIIYQTIFSMILSNLLVVVFTKAICGKSYKEYSKKYKSVVIDKLMNNFYDNSEYFPEKPMPQYIYDEGKYDEYYNRYHSEDYLEGQIDNTYSIQMGEVVTKKVERRDGKTHTTIKFHGLFAKIVMHKSMQGELKIMQDGKFALDNKLKMDSSEFEKYFDVKASDKIKGMQLLTADVMEELMEFENNTRMRFDIVIRNNELYLRFHSGSMFEPKNIKGGALNKEEIQKYFYMLNLTYNLSKRLISLVNETEM